MSSAETLSSPKSKASLAGPPDPLLPALEGLRIRLATLAESLNDYYVTISTSPTFPAWRTLTLKAAQVSSAMAAVSEIMAVNHTFSEVHAFPNDIFPGHTAPLILQQLLRKKLEPGVEDWIVSGQAMAEGWVRKEGETGEEAKGKLALADWKVLWQGAPGAEETRNASQFGPRLYLKVLEQINRRYLGYVDYTKAETDRGVENVKTGLKRQLQVDPGDVGVGGDDDGDEDEEDEDEDESTDDKMPVAATPAEAPALSINDYLKFMNMGVMPPGVAAASPGATTADSIPV